MMKGQIAGLMKQAADARENETGSRRAQYDGDYWTGSKRFGQDHHQW